ncbi:hypothetical protein SAMN06297468_2943 [Altererythrobacter xiamenensis]|uniref:Uncharacterized protein n=1 Tax=Altererythrobacter xiamenensis TaxID=1316679 RepID=A0A1Y6FQL1_9SPHN|nr:hypothetical protein SAMN06297468_2943 [Altererythrobacter xiamenensis]
MTLGRMLVRLMLGGHLPPLRPLVTECQPIEVVKSWVESGHCVLRDLFKQRIAKEMRSLADKWWNEDRRDLFRSLEVIASDTPNPDGIGLSLDTILNDLELYDDPMQGRGSWLFDNELHLARALGEKLKKTVDQARLVEAGPATLASVSWPDARRTAVSLLSLMAVNGDFTG